MRAIQVQPGHQWMAGLSIECRGFAARAAIAVGCSPANNESVDQATAAASDLPLLGSAASSGSCQEEHRGRLVDCYG